MIFSTFDQFVFPNLDWVGSGDKHDRHDLVGFSVRNDLVRYRKGQQLSPNDVVRVHKLDSLMIRGKCDDGRNFETQESNRNNREDHEILG